ncbi:MAG: glycosyltransferase [Lachnospiraceae bacterium]
MRKEILIIILNYKTYKLTFDIIRQLNQLDTCLFDICVIDNNSPNESSNELEKAADELNYIFLQSSENRGYAAGNNIGINYSIKNNYVYSLIMNNDLVITDHFFIHKLLNRIKEDDKIACIGPKIIDSDGIPVSPYCKRPSFFSMTIGIVMNKRNSRMSVEIPQKVYRVYGCCMLLRNDALKSINGLDERTFLYYEEDILAERLISKGYNTYYFPETSIIHLESMTVKKENKKHSFTKTKIVLESMYVYLKYYRHYSLLKIRLCQFVRGAITMIRG